MPRQKWRSAGEDGEYGLRTRRKGAEHGRFQLVQRGGDLGRSRSWPCVSPAKRKSLFRGAPSIRGNYFFHGERRACIFRKGRSAATEKGDLGQSFSSHLQMKTKSCAVPGGDASCLRRQSCEHLRESKSHWPQWGLLMSRHA